MSIKQGIVDTVDLTGYIVIGLVLISGFLIAIGGHPLGGMLVAGVGWLICSLVWGFWYATSAIAQNTAKNNELMQKQNSLLEKIYRELEANNINQFPSE